MVNLLLQFEEPTDSQLHEIMKEVAEEAKIKAEKAHQELLHLIDEQISKLNEKYSLKNL